jgi:hypothetical protein
MTSVLKRLRQEDLDLDSWSGLPHEKKVKKKKKNSALEIH